MDCKQIQKKLIFYIEGDLDSVESAKIISHIEVCKECEFLLSQLKSSLLFLEQEKQTETNPFFFSRVMAGLEKEPKQSFIINWLRRKQYSLQIVGYSILVFLAITAGHYLGKDKITIEMETATQENVISDNQLFAESYQFQINEEDVYIIKADEN